MPGNSSPFAYSAKTIAEILAAAANSPSERDTAGELCALPWTARAIVDTEWYIPGLDDIPALSDVLYRSFEETGKREYGRPYWLRRQRVVSMTLRILAGDASLVKQLNRYLEAICDEATWVEPQHDGRPIDLSSASTGATLAYVVNLLKDGLEARTTLRIFEELDSRIFKPYLALEQAFLTRWGPTNWNSVCSSGIALAFLYAEPDQKRVGQAICQALRGLRFYLEEGFAGDGSTTEGVSYWHYGISWLTLFAEALRDRTNGAVNLLGLERVQLIASYPAKLRLSGRDFAPFSDSDERPLFTPGIIARLAERTHEASLPNLIESTLPFECWDMPTLLAEILWRPTTDTIPDQTSHGDLVLPDAGIVRFETAYRGVPIVLMAKAGHNGEHHNHNDVGSFVLHVDGENLLTDPGSGAYDNLYFTDRRYESVFANSHGHSVPLIAGRMQGTGPEFCGRLTKVETHGDVKSVSMDFRAAYPVESSGAAGIRFDDSSVAPPPEDERTAAPQGPHSGTEPLAEAERTLEMTADTGSLALRDRFVFNGSPLEVREVLITRFLVRMDGSGALVIGERHALHIVIEKPADVSFSLEELQVLGKYDTAPSPLRRLSFVASLSGDTEICLRMDVLPQDKP